MADPPFNFKGKIQLGPFSLDVDTNAPVSAGLDQPQPLSELNSFLQERDALLDRLKQLNESIKKLRGRG